jgi:hypothetical protein
MQKAVREQTASAEPNRQTNHQTSIRVYSPAKNFRMRSSPRSNSAFEVA